MVIMTRKIILMNQIVTTVIMRRRNLNLSIQHTKLNRIFASIVLAISFTSIFFQWPLQYRIGIVENL
ncbi:MAG: hypothetical protein Ct9H300mP18_14110 [Candidatus Neomarinimicrobiota bacterium]|nr:MAG: hypothetical protein Ct9H300mP18_14110 [Candidatus Neomarinimicrobiota bacterium]